MKKALSLFLSFIMLIFGTTPVIAADESAITNDFVGVINLYTSADPQHMQWNAVLHEEELVMMTPEDIAEIAGVTHIDYNSADNSYDFSRNNYRVHVDVDTLAVEVYVDITSTGYFMPYDSFKLDYIGTAVLDGEECTIFPLEQMLYLLNVQWQCRDDCVYTFAPKETLWNIMGDYLSMVKCLPQKYELIGTSVSSILSNSVMFSVLAVGDEISLTMFVPQVGFTDEKTKQALLAMSSPCENIVGDLSEKAEQMLDVYISLVGDSAGMVGDAGNILENLGTTFELFSNGFAKLKTLSDTAAMKKITDGGAMVATSLSTVAGLVNVSLSMTRALAWTETYLEQINYLTNLNDSLNEELCNVIRNQATIIAMENAEPFAMAAAEGAVVVGKNTVDFLLNGTPVGQILSVYKLCVAALSAVPAVQTALESGDDAYNAMDLCSLSTLMRSKYKKAADDIEGGVTQEYLDNVRLTGSLMMNASAHGYDKMYSVLDSMNKDTSVIEHKLLYANTATLRFQESAMYDPSLLLVSKFSNLYSEEDGGIRQKIPPEYVHDPVPIHISACIGEDGGVTYCTNDVPNSDFVKLPVEAAEYDYISSFLFYGGKLYYSCKDYGTSDYRSALYRCNPDGSELEKLFGDEDLDYTTSFHISFGNLYPHGSYRYYNIDKEAFVESEEYIYDFGALPDWYNEEYVFSQSNGSTISREKYDMGDVYQRTEYQDIVQLDSMWSRICGLTSTALYYQTDQGNTSSLYRYDLKTGSVSLVDSKQSAGSGGYFSW